MTQRVLLIAIVFLTINIGVFGAGGNLPGAGSENNPYLIEDITDFSAFADSDNAGIYWAPAVHVKLTVPLDLSETVYTTAPIAPDTNSDNLMFSGEVYRGMFDGNAKPIRHLTINADSGNDYLGLFGMIEYAMIDNVVLADVQITVSSNSFYTGGLCGYSFESQIETCSAECTIVATGADCDNIGGLIGYSEWTLIYDSFATGSIQGAGTTGGGLAGYCTGGAAVTCYAKVNVNGQNQLGGFVGYNDQTLSNCYARGNVTGVDQVGGFVGRNNSDSNQIIQYCYSTGKPTGTETIGGFCAVNTGSADDGCFWDKTTSGTDISAMGTGLITFWMQMSTLYHNAGWMFIETFGQSGLWHMPYEAEGYPMLFFQKDIPGDVTGRYGVDVEDLMTFSQCWLASSDDATFNPDCDLEQDTTAGQITIEDIAILFDHWLEGIH